ncbi:MAG: ribose 5-phosphate isomerase B, partial [Saprospiraceae bacterium]
IALGADHAGFEVKQLVLKSLQAKNINCIDYGTYSPERADYPDFAHPVANAVEEGAADYGVLVCGSGNGVAMTANKHKGIRAAICWKEELAILARAHNNANIICIPGRFIDPDLAPIMVDLFLKTEFEGGRHALRVEKISNC